MSLYSIHTPKRTNENVPASIFAKKEDFFLGKKTSLHALPCMDNEKTGSFTKSPPFQEGIVSAWQNPLNGKGSLTLPAVQGNISSDTGAVSILQVKGFRNLRPVLIPEGNGTVLSLPGQLQVFSLQLHHINIGLLRKDAVIGPGQAQCFKDGERIGIPIQMKNHRMGGRFLPKGKIHDFNIHKLRCHFSIGYRERNRKLS